jgi:ISXO2-like transposase domain
VPVFCAVQRGGDIRRRIVADIRGNTLKAALREEVDYRAKIMSDENSAYRGLDLEFASHDTVTHSTREYVRGDVHSNTAESSHALVKRGIVGIYHNVSREYLHRYLWHFDFLWNNREMNDGERTIAGIKGAEGKRLMYREPIAG